MKTYNTETLTNLISEIDGLIENSKILNQTKKQTIDTLFKESMDMIIDIYIATKEATNGGTFKSIISDIIQSLKTETKKTSIHAILDIIEYTALNRAIKHELISYRTAKRLLDNKDILSKKYITLLKNIAETDTKKYIAEINKIINLAITEEDEKFIVANEKLYTHLLSKSEKELVDIKRMLKLVEAKNKGKNKED